uniref:poly(ADP-ribose) glycohydrolase n=1 Tax=Chromera velia CCMP2878 TaxID=1169474 RepID=A0A0G4HFU9_9ALVE|eukprot:Cvel_27166.t1-p1 / transcript=Cvel_27166.t1 / gene=Cvel_27166 / organism=Chromera_velia_CCMP2878 / gene_product=Poly(ADP-ribose) glycohydrolase, putative / transcript_product=Poly(ADP-ribose) glycohydrolase, putative / location=Cvel_scaffold3346:7446-11439(+) / protein_length=689 / sequence_SO=supercontig / SO=protein_coding / is_pseudo=false
MRPIFLLGKDRRGEVHLSALQCFVLLSLGFLCIVPFQPLPNMPGINFFRLYNAKPSSRGKFACLVHYFNCMAASVDRQETKELNRVVTFERTHRDEARGWDSVEVVMSRLYDMPLTDVVVKTENDLIEDRPEALQADFAASMLGGGILGHGCVQEEIRFAIAPELICSRILVTGLGENEAALFTGARTFSKYTGYADSFAFDGDGRDGEGGRAVVGEDTIRLPPSGRDRDKEREVFQRKVVTVVAIDAISYGKSEQNRLRQFQPKHVLRDLNKVSAGLFGRGRDGKESIGRDKLQAGVPGTNPDERVPFATGNWGCGAFGGDPQLKSMIQWVACSEAGRHMLYFPFTDTRVDGLGALVDAVKKAEPPVTAEELLFMTLRRADDIFRGNDSYESMYIDTELDEAGVKACSSSLFDRLHAWLAVRALEAKESPEKFDYPAPPLVPAFAPPFDVSNPFAASNGGGGASSSSAAAAAAAGGGDGRGFVRGKDDGMELGDSDDGEWEEVPAWLYEQAARESPSETVEHSAPEGGGGASPRTPMFGNPSPFPSEGEEEEDGGPRGSGTRQGEQEDVEMGRESGEDDVDVEGAGGVSGSLWGGAAGGVADSNGEGETVSYSASAAAAAASGGGFLRSEDDGMGDSDVMEERLRDTAEVSDDSPSAPREEEQPPQPAATTVVDIESSPEPSQTLPLE